MSVFSINQQGVQNFSWFGQDCQPFFQRKRQIEQQQALLKQQDERLSEQEEQLKQLEKRIQELKEPQRQELSLDKQQKVCGDLQLWKNKHKEQRLQLGREQDEVKAQILQCRLQCRQEEAKEQVQQRFSPETKPVSASLREQLRSLLLQIKQLEQQQQKLALQESKVTSLLETANEELNRQKAETALCLPSPSKTSDLAELEVWEKKADEFLRATRQRQEQLRKKQYEDGKNASLCKVCFEHDMDMLLEPCNHICLSACAKCAVLEFQPVLFVGEELQT